MSTSTQAYTTGSVPSADGTIIGYRQVGSGPGMLLLPSGMQASQHYMRLATALASAFTVYVVDRRGRGSSGPHGDQYGMTRECEDVDALLAQTGAHFVFGHSSSGLIALQAALTLPSIRRVAIYEPPLFLHGSISTSWIPRFDREIAEGKLASALITFIKADNLNRLPRWVLLPLLKWYLQREKKTLLPNDIPMEALIPTQRFDGLLVKEMDGSLENFAGMDWRSPPDNVGNSYRWERLHCPCCPMFVVSGQRPTPRATQASPPRVHILPRPYGDKGRISGFGDLLFSIDIQEIIRL